MIISVPSSLNLSHKSLVSRWQTTCRSSSELKRSCKSGFFGGDGEDGGDFLPPRLPECPALQSDVDDEISGGLSRSSSSNSSSLLARGVVGSGELLATEEDVVVVSTNFSEREWANQYDVSKSDSVFITTPVSPYYVFCRSNINKVAVTLYPIANCREISY